MNRDRIKILIADDEEIVRESLSGWLEKDGYTLDVAEDGPRALVKLKADRKQHSSHRILLWLAANRPRGTARLIGLTDADLFIPVLTFVFGEAQLKGPVAVVSTARLAGAGLPGEAARFPIRLRTEVIHELGHTFGLLHCTSPRCAMARSASLRDVDAKHPDLCETCRALFLENVDEIGEPHEQEEHTDPAGR